MMGDFPEPVVLVDDDLLALEEGRCARVAAAGLDLHEIGGRDALAELAWHAGSLHLPAQIEADRMIEHDHMRMVMAQ